MFVILLRPAWKLQNAVFNALSIKQVHVGNAVIASFVSFVASWEVVVQFHDLFLLLDVYKQGIRLITQGKDHERKHPFKKVALAHSATLDSGVI